MVEAAKIGGQIGEVRDEVVRWRRHLHRHPELSFEEEETARFVHDTLESFGGLELSRPTPTSVVARLVGEAGEDGSRRRTIALRADMDALPITEETGLEFASENEGVMHACGHDGHTAMLLGAAKVLLALKDQLADEVRFVFQHAEEVYPGGAEELVEAGVMDGADAAIGLHLSSYLPVGRIGTGYGPRSAAPDTFEIVVKGEGGHAARPHLAVDPVAVAAQIVINLQHVVSRETDPLRSVVLSVTKVAGGTTPNVVPDEVELEGTVRTLSEQVREGMPGTMERIVRGVCEAHEASYSFDYQRGPGPVINDEAVTKAAEGGVYEAFGEEAVVTMDPVMGGEDFSAYRRVVPGAFFGVGAGNEEKGIGNPHHHPGFDIDEDALENGVKVYVYAALALLNKEEKGNGARG